MREDYIIRPIKKSDQNEAYKVWYENGGGIMVELFRKKIIFYKRFEVAFSLLASLLVNIYLPILVAVVWLVYINYQARKTVDGYSKEMRTDMNDICKHFGDKFLIAQRQENGKAGEIVETVGYKYNNDRTLMEITSLAVAKNVRNRGIASRFMKLIHDIADESKLPIGLTTSLENTGACHFYRRNGYEEYLPEMKGSNKFQKDCINLGVHDVRFTRKAL